MLYSPFIWKLFLHCPLQICFLYCFCLMQYGKSRISKNTLLFMVSLLLLIISILHAYMFIETCLLAVIISWVRVTWNSIFHNHVSSSGSWGGWSLSQLIYGARQGTQVTWKLDLSNSACCNLILTSVKIWKSISAQTKTGLCPPSLTLNYISNGSLNRSRKNYYSNQKTVQLYSTYLPAVSGMTWKLWTYSLIS